MESSRRWNCATRSISCWVCSGTLKSAGKRTNYLARFSCALWMWQFLRGENRAKSMVTPRIMTDLQSNQSLEKKDKLAIFSLSAGHFINDAYSNLLGLLLPLLIANLNLTITQAGWLGGILVVSSSFTQPLYGYISDRYLKRFFAVFSPLITAVFMSCIGLAPNFWALACLLAC